jgi:potassium efflux system protein
MRAARVLLTALVALVLAVSAGFALDRAIIGETDRALQQLRVDLDGASMQLRRPNLSDQDLASLKVSLEKIRTTAADRSLKLLVPLGEVTQQLNSLGAAPPAGQKEDDGVAQSRADLTATRDKLQSIKAQLDVVTVEAEQISKSVSTMQRDQFFGRIFDRSRSILNPDVWFDLVAGIGVLFTGLALLLRNWWTDVSQTAKPLGLLMIPVIIIGAGVGFRLINRFFARWLTGYSNSGRPVDNMTRLWIILRALIVTFAALAVVFLPIRFSLEVSGYFSDATPRMLMLWEALRDTVFTTFFYYVLGRRVTAPGRPEIRIVDIDDRAASQVTFLFGLTAFIAAFNKQLGQVSGGMFLSLNYTQGQTALGALTLLVLTSIILLVLRRQPGLPDEDKRRFYFSWAAKLVPLIWLLVSIGFAALIFGYLALGDYIAHQIVRTAMVVTLVFLVYHLLDSMVQASFDPQSNFGIFLRRITGLGERAIERIGLIFRTIVDLVLVLAGIPLLLLLWTLNWVDMRGLINTLSLGVTIGDVTILPGTLAIMLAILVAGVIATKLFNSWLDRRILSDTRIKKGVQDSILTGSSYIGYLLAGIFALTAAGVDFSSLAIIAGALGLGIGLGLQSIINNFVSGVILLAERPIRVGDWVSLPEGEGIVRRINVRSTEIETFDSCSIILPNSALVTEAVKNWTHNDDMGRFSIDVVVDYDTDPDVMRSLLLEVTKAHPKVLKHPAPNVLLTGFGKNGLEFVVRAFVADVLNGAQVASDIRFALLSQFRDKGITIAQAVAVVQAGK